VKSPVERILAKLGMPTLVEALSARLSGADLTSLLLEVMRRRAADVTAADLVQRYGSDRFVVAPAASFRSLRRAEEALIAACPANVDLLALAPLVPLGTHSAIATVDQNKVVSNIRGTEVAADPTNALALEASVRRAAALRRDGKSAEIVRLGATQRVVRAQHVSGPGYFAHFQLFGFVTAGRDTGGRAFDAMAAGEHLLLHTRALVALGAARITVSLTDFSGGRVEPLTAAVRRTLAGVPGVTCVDDPDRKAGRGYYRDFCFKVHAAFAGDPFETSDGGCVDWTQRLVGSVKERCFISGIGIDRLALAIAPP
jgi:hypothetical protein